MSFGEVLIHSVFIQIAVLIDLDVMAFVNSVICVLYPEKLKLLLQKEAQSIVLNIVQYVSVLLFIKIKTGIF